eukprot:TRINITY_DN15237_c1_g1_i1.p2 TRINITY_DN15237_c1_g1~~TRINITY_DN15237_c1_g1_i1.p2  ORF type:complete len:213 (-),score=12.48 TRINITY_DN15237_c1_g1_i1:697-1335(-)
MQLFFVFFILFFFFFFFLYKTDGTNSATRIPQYPFCSSNPMYIIRRNFDTILQTKIVLFFYHSGLFKNFHDKNSCQTQLKISVSILQNFSTIKLQILYLNTIILTLSYTKNHVSSLGNKGPDFTIQNIATVVKKAAELAIIGQVSSVLDTMGPKPKETNSDPQRGEKSNTHIHRYFTKPAGSNLLANPQIIPPATDKIRVKQYQFSGNPGTT